MGWGKLAGGRRLVKENLSPFERKNYCFSSASGRITAVLWASNEPKLLQNSEKYFKYIPPLLFLGHVVDIVRIRLPVILVILDKTKGLNNLVCQDPSPNNPRHPRHDKSTVQYQYSLIS